MLENFIFFEKNENNIEDKIQILNDLIEENKELKKKNCEQLLYCVKDII